MTADKTPTPISSEDAQKGTDKADKGHTLERPNPKTESVDKVLTPNCAAVIDLAMLSGPTCAQPWRLAR